MLRPLTVLCAFSLCACHISLHDDLEVDGVRLAHHHEETLTLEAWPAGGLVIEAHRGDLRVEPAAGPTTLTLRVHEREPGEAHAHVADGRLTVRAVDGRACAIGDVVLRTAGPVRGLVLSTGRGDVEMRDVAAEGELKLATGMGDIELHAAGEPAGVELATGMGDIDVSRLRCARFAAETGMGDVSIDALEAENAKISSGLGDVDVGHSKGGRLEASSGLGDVEVVASSFSARDLDTGLGRVREH